MDPFWFGKSGEELKTLRHFSMQYSFSKFPPCLEVFHGLGTEPFSFESQLLLIGFTLSTWVYFGCFQIFVKNFTAHVNYITLPTTQSILVASSRLKMIFRAIAGVTGLVRRNSCLFLWLCLLRLNNMLTPNN